MHALSLIAGEFAISPICSKRSRAIISALSGRAPRKAGSEPAEPIAGAEPRPALAIGC
jgi:hypothetical protein